MKLNDELTNSLSTVCAQLNINHSDYLLRMDMNESEYKKFIKEKLIQQLVQEMMNSDLIEFTAQEDMNRMSRNFRARIVSIPSGVVGKLRREGKIL